MMIPKMNSSRSASVYCGKLSEDEVKLITSSYVVPVIGLYCVVCFHSHNGYHRGGMLSPSSSMLMMSCGGVIDGGTTSMSVSSLISSSAL